MKVKKPKNTKLQTKQCSTDLYQI